MNDLNEYFDDMFKEVDPNILLDEQQREAITIDSDNLLVVAGAGSGKSTTMVAKVKYLIDKCGYKESEIVVVSFTKKVKEELSEIIHDKFGLKNVAVTTFHSLGLEIINKSGEDVADVVDEKGQYKIFSNYIKNVLFKDKEKFSLLNDAFSKYLNFGDQWMSFDDFDTYHTKSFVDKFNKSEESIKVYIENQILRRRQYKKTINGEYTASKEEVDIANLLYINGIDYNYELKLNNGYKKGRGYHPDFYIHQLEKENYIEHFGVDQDGSNSMYSESELKNYLSILKIKDKYINSYENRNKFIVTYSRYDNGKTYLTDLIDQLKHNGYVPHKRSDEEIFAKLMDTGTDYYFSVFVDKILVPVISMYKQSGYSYRDYDSLIESNDGNLKNQLIVLKMFHEYYEKELSNKHLIDFEDMILKAYTLMPIIKEKDLGVDYKYLIIDEYQDISNQRLNLVKRLVDLFDAKVMAVGDDWQTIFGYAGSRIDLFKNFSKELPNSDQVAIEHTYRNSQELIDIAGEFVLKNPYQIKKHLISDKHTINPVEIIFYDDEEKEKVNGNRAKYVDAILGNLSKINPNCSVLLLGRYQKDIYKIDDKKYFNIMGSKIKSVNYENIDLEFLTIHKAKGLGRDYAILLDLNDDKYGFPSKIDDLPIIKLIRPKIEESIDFPEERRLFYVALTRTKNKIYILVPKCKESEFSIEIKKFHNVRILK
ncbi:MAG: UvrD-helicase domain-containing protein [Bacilli bacterium]|nr:UvrD-helicase domain-containing protein [Bacilli bacterium]